MERHRHARRETGHGDLKAICIPEARVVQGKHAPKWAPQPLFDDLGSGRGPLTYERVTPVAESAVALVYGLWPLFFITAVGIALLWSGTVYGTP